MSNGKLVYSQLLDFLDRNHFNYLVRKYDGDKYVKNFTCYNQLAVLKYGQLSNRESLRDVVFAAQALEDKAYRLGFGKNVSKSTLADANNKRDYHIFEQFAYHTVAEARECRASDIFKLGATYMPLTQRLSNFAWRHSNGPFTGRISEKAASKYIPCMTLRLPSRHSSTSRKPV